MNSYIAGQSKCMVVSYDDELKDHLRIFDDDSETLIKGYIRAATQYIENYLGFPALSYDMTVIGTPYNYRFDVPRNVIEVTKVEEFGDGVWTEMTLDSYELEDYGNYKCLYNTDFLRDIRYRFTCNCDPLISPLMKHAAYLLIGEMYENRENTNKNTSVFRANVNLILDLEKIELL
jgi:hypothetical protein